MKQPTHLKHGASTTQWIATKSAEMLMTNGSKEIKLNCKTSKKEVCRG